MESEWKVSQEDGLIGSVKAKTKKEAKVKATGLPMYNYQSETTHIWKAKKSKKYWK